MNNYDIDKIANKWMQMLSRRLLLELKETTVSDKVGSYATSKDREEMVAKKTDQALLARAEVWKELANKVRWAGGKDENDI